MTIFQHQEESKQGWIPSPLSLSTIGERKKYKSPNGQDIARSSSVRNKNMSWERMDVNNPYRVVNW